MSYQLIITKRAQKELEAIPERDTVRIVRSIKLLQEDPRPAGCKKLQGIEDLWRIRVGDYRVLYSIEDKIRIIEIKRIVNRRDAY